jgi:hypothetical protein
MVTTASEPLRIIVIAGDKRSGYMEARNLGIEPVAVVTPRSPHGARGKIADRIMEATSLAPADRDRLLPSVLPALATSSR